jgi:hypothetical protein
VILCVFKLPGIVHELLISPTQAKVRKFLLFTVGLSSSLQMFVHVESDPNVAHLICELSINTGGSEKVVQMLLDAGARL